MQIKILARSFFEACKGTPSEVLLFMNYHIISINSVSLPEPPPFSLHFLKKPNLLVLHFDDVEKGKPHAMTDADAEKIAAFIRQPKIRRLIIHCTAGISRSGAVGEAVNWYFHRRIDRDDLAFRRFFRANPDIVPNVYVRKTLLEKIIGKQSGNCKSLENTKKRRIFPTNIQWIIRDNMKSGFWGNYQTGEYFEIDEHELWIRRGKNAQNLGISSDIEARFPEFKPRTDRDHFLTFLFANAPVMRMRGHGQFVTMEFHSSDWEKPLALIREWCRKNAGPLLGLNIINMKTNESIQTSWENLSRDYKKIASEKKRKKLT